MENTLSYWSPLCRVVSQSSCWVRLVTEQEDVDGESDWGMLLTMPVEGYLEGPGGPVPLRHVAWVEISTRRLKGGLAGRPLTFVDIQEDLLAALKETRLRWQLLDTTWSIER